MSAYMVSKAHIDALVATALYGPSGKAEQYRADFLRYVWRDRQPTADVIGETLIKENLSSIHARYPDTVTNPDNTPGPCEQYWLTGYRFSHRDAMRKRLTIVEAFKAIDCYEYQACEHAEWEESKAHEFCERFRSALISALPGYDAAPWGID